MLPQSLKGTLLLGLTGLVMACSLSVALIASHRYSASLHATLAAEGERLAHGLALQVADPILINDLVTLQKTLDRQMSSRGDIVYLLVVRDGRVLAHTFEEGVPEELITANAPAQDGRPSQKELVAAHGPTLIDLAWPVFEGRAGVLRLGLSESQNAAQIARLLSEIGLFTLLILLLAVGGGLYFVRRLTRPLAELVDAASRVEPERMAMAVAVPEQAELAALAVSFNGMVARLGEAMRDLEGKRRELQTKTIELEEAHGRMSTSCEIMRGVSAIGELSGVARYLIRRLRGIMPCGEMSFLVFDSRRDALYRAGERDFLALRAPETTAQAEAALQGLPRPTRHAVPLLAPPLVPPDMDFSHGQGIAPLRQEGELIGALVTACAPGCACDLDEADMISLILGQVAGTIRRAVRHEEERELLRPVTEQSQGCCGLVGKDQRMQTVYRLIEDVAPTDATVLILGESGTGKEMAARALHERSLRHAGPFVVINCSAYPETLLESELFGFERGAFTGAVRARPGRFEQADGGTVFLDEIGEISPSAQVKLLRVLQTQEVERLGGNGSRKVDVRVVAATNRDLAEEVRRGSFREDLYYRLSVIPLTLPPLRERRGDIPLLARHFLSMQALRSGREVTAFSSEAMRILLAHSWPGNVRELENSVEHALVLAKGDRIEAEDLPGTVRDAEAVLQAGSPAAPQGERLRDNERQLVLDALRAAGGNKKEAARRLGISRSTLYAKIERHGIGTAEIAAPSSRS